MNDALLKYGLEGIVIIGMGIAIRYLIKWIEKKDRDARSERESMMNMIQEMSDKHNEMVKDISDKQNQLTRENTNVLTGLKTLLETRNGRR